MGCGAAGHSSRTFCTGRRLDDLFGSEERFEGIKKFRRVPLRCAFHLAENLPFAIDQEGGWQILDFESSLRSALRIEVGLDRFETEFVNKRLDDLAAAAVLRHCNDDDLIAEARLHPFEGWHLAYTRLTPSGPEID